jgi:hypothetical protein
MTIYALPMTRPNWKKALTSPRGCHSKAARTLRDEEIAGLLRNAAD